MARAPIEGLIGFYVLATAALGLVVLGAWWLGGWDFVYKLSLFLGILFLCAKGFDVLFPRY